MYENFTLILGVNFQDNYCLVLNCAKDKDGVIQLILPSQLLSLVHYTKINIYNNQG